MERHARVREVKLNIESEFVLNLVTHFVQQEGYTFVGNENEIWLENLDHPKFQMVHINAQKRMTHIHATYLMNKSEFISKNIKKAFLMRKVEVLVLNTSEYDESVMTQLAQSNFKMINVESAQDVYEQEVLLASFPNLKNTNLSVETIELLMRLQVETKRRAMNEVMRTRVKVMPLVTYTFVAITVLFFLYLWLRQQQLPEIFVAIHYGSTYNPLILGGEYWRLFVSSIMHLTLPHLLFNVIFIFRFGTMIENTFQTWRFIVIILASALMSALFGFAFTTSHSLGASGVAYGLIGASVFLGFEMRKVYMPILKHVVLPMIVVSTLFSFMIPNIDHFGHLGGFIGGFLAATIVGVVEYKPFITRSVIAAFTFVVLLSGLWINGTNLTNSHDFDRLNRALIWQYIELGDYDRAIRLSEIFSNGME